MERWMTVVAATAWLGLAIGGCSNPADESTAARVSEPVPTPTATGAPGGGGSVETASVPAGALPIATAESKVEFVGSKVTGSHSGGFQDFTGHVVLSPDGKEVQAIQAEIDMNSTYSDNEKLTGHLKAPDFFDVAKFPKATFVSTEIKPGGEKGASHTVTGNLTLHGVTKSISFPATLTVDEGSVAIDSDFFINRKDFGIEYPGMPNDLIRDEVVIKLAVKAPKA